MAGTHDHGSVRGPDADPETSPPASHPTLAALGCPFHRQPEPTCTYCDAHPAYEASRVDWVNRCPACQGGDIRQYESATAKYKWCGDCGKQEGAGL